jgi:hypothetical protein
MAQTEHLVLPDQKENMDLEDRQEHLVKMACTEWMDYLVQQDPKDQLE